MKILFVADRRPQTFVLADRGILQSRHDVDWLSFQWSTENLRRLSGRIARADLVFGWFASHHTFLPAMLAKSLRKKLVIAAADYDLANEPSFDYGSMRGGVRAWVNNRIFYAADLVLVPSEFSRSLALRNTVLKHTPDKVEKVVLGFSASDALRHRKDGSMLTVGAINSEYWIRKGHREFVEVAKRMPDVPAYMVGRVEDETLATMIRRSAGGNVQLCGFLADEELRRLYESTQVYAQLSYMEGFGCSVAEAMLARCVPVVTPRGSLPEVVGDCGYYAGYGDIGASCAAVQSALVDSRIGKLARERILDCFPLDSRRRQLLELLETVMDKRRSPEAPVSHLDALRRSDASYVE